MIPLIESHRPDVAALCGRFGVRSLDVFGSAANGRFDSARSDIDFLVDFNEDDAGSLFHRYFGLQEALEQLFGRKVDLVSLSGLSNPYFIAAVNQSRQLVFASARAQAVQS
jgi:predicted nucleotidyltransferase